MDSTKPENSISSSISLPQWMKSKMNDRYDMNEPFSPPSYDDNFYIRYPKSKETSVNVPRLTQQKHFRPISELLEKDPGLSRHTAPCRQFIPQIKMSGQDLPGISVTKTKKSHGVDDGFTGEAASCGKSVVHVAQQMTAAKFPLPSFPSADDPSRLAAETYDFGKRRGSKSLPVSPLTSPDASPRNARKHNPNRYFTGVFAAPSDKPGQELRYPGGWILSGLMGQRERDQNLARPIHEEESHHVTDDMAVVAAEEKTSMLEVPTNGLRRNKSTPVIGLMGSEEGTSEGKKTVRPKPSELREMNFWSPTSM